MNGLIHRFRQHVKSNPTSIAVEDDVHVLTFEKLDQWSDALAQEISTRGRPTNATEIQTVALCIPRSTLLLLSILAVVKAGYAYVPLDPAAPLARIEDQLTQCEARLVLVSSETIEAQLKGVLRQTEILDVASFVTRPGIEDETNVVLPEVKVDGAALLAILFTSGSTGRPKGVLIEHRSMINVVDGPTLEISPGDHVALNANPSFDAASFEIWDSLVHGAHIFILTAHLADTDAVVNFFREQNIQKAFLPTAVFHRLFSDHAAAASLGTTLRMINIGGERLNTNVVKTFLQCAPHTRLTNGYGSAETTVCATLFEVTQDALEFDDGAGRPIPIGRPIPNTQSFLLDDDLRVVEFGQPGEICICGAALARGYLDPSGVASAKFTTIANLEGPGTSTRVYRTGDIGKLIPSRDGPLLEYVGRNDRQVKIRGQRVEPGEIEAVLCSGMGWAGEAAVVVTEDDKMIAYVVKSGAGAGVGAGADAGDEQTVKLAVNQEAWDAFHAQYDWEKIDPTLAGADFTGYTSMYDDSPIPRSEMLDWLSDTITSIPSHPTSTVLEIGCGSGMILFSIESKIKEYVGIDIFEPALAFVRAQLARRGISERCTVLRGEANQLDQVLPDDKTFDVVIFNSVVQYFPSREYLEDVLRLCIARVSDGGRVFLGDVRAYALESHHNIARVLHCDPSPDLSTSDIQGTIDQWQVQQSELLINPSFFYQLRGDKSGGRISHVQILPKMMASANEFSKFRYQVVLHIGSTPTTLVTPTPWMEYTNPSELRDAMVTKDDDTLAVRGIPNALVSSEETMLHLFQSSTAPPPPTAAELLASATSSDQYKRAYALSPLDITSMAANYGWRAELSWASLGVDRTLSAVFTRGESTTLLADFGDPELDGEPTNSPIHGRFKPPLSPTTTTTTTACEPQEVDLPTTLHALCRTKLPTYMVPDHIILKDALPLTNNGKVDRRVLAQRSTWAGHLELWGEGVVSEVGGGGHVAGSETEGRVQRCVGGILEIPTPQVSLDRPLIELGLHSFRVPKLLASLRSEFKLKVLPYTTVFKYPSIVALAAHIDELVLISGSNFDAGEHHPQSEEKEKGEEEEKLLTNGSGKREVSYDHEALDEVLRIRGLSVEDVEDVYETTTTQKMCLRDPSPMAHELWTAQTTLPTLLHALEVVISRHAILRTTFFDLGTRQVVFLPSPKILSQVLSIHEPVDPQTMYTTLRDNADGRYVLHPPDNLFRLEVYRTDPPSVLCYFQQATIDAWSRERLFDEIESVVLGHSLQDPVPFRNFVDYEVNATKNPEHAGSLGRRLSQVDAIPFPIDDAPASGYITRSILGPNLERSAHIPGLQHVLQSYSIQPSTFLKIAMALVVRNETKRKSVAFGQIHFCRNVPVEGIELICGLTLGPQIDCVDFREGESVLELLRRTQAMQNEAMDGDNSLFDMEEVARQAGKDLIPFFRFAWNLRSEEVKPHGTRRKVLQPGPVGFDTDLAIAWTTVMIGESLVKVEVDYDKVFSERVKIYVEQFFRAAGWLTDNIEAQSVDSVQLNSVQLNDLE